MESIQSAFEEVFHACETYPDTKFGLRSSDPAARKAYDALLRIKRWLEAEKFIPPDYRLQLSRGSGAFPRVPWVTILPPNQQTNKGVYVSICFDRKGRGVVAGFAESASNPAGLDTVRRRGVPSWKLDVDGTSSGTRYNDGYVNPAEFERNSFAQDALLRHLKASLALCQRYLAAETRGVLGRYQLDAGEYPKHSQTLLSKPFLILTGNSGTGKTKLAEKFGETYRNDDELRNSGNYAVVAVGADWTDNRSVVGFVNHLREASLETPKDKRPVYQSTPVLDLLLHANQHKDWPHFLILDEMNLSHVERYFADFLSAMEARDGVLRLHSEGPADQPDYLLPRSDGDKVGVPRRLDYPENLFVIGTVNVDETTYMFSPKVLDRAHVIEFEVDPTAIEAFLEKPAPLSPARRAPDAGAFGFLQLSKNARAIGGGSVEPLPLAVAQKINAHLMAVLRILQRGRFEFAFRTANEVNTYLRVCRELADDKSAWESGGWKTDLDDEILQKVLPRLHGSRARVGNLIGALVCYFAKGEEAEALQFFPADGQEEAVKTLTDAITLAPKPPQFPRCFKKMQTMARVLVEEQFVSFIC
jgi:hypothetical protein